MDSVTAAAFRRLAQSLPGVEEHVHMAHPDFRVGGKIFEVALEAAWRRRAPTQLKAAR